MVVAEVALALVLLTGAGLAVRSLAALSAVDVGFRAERLLTLSTRLPRTSYSEPARRLAFYDRVLEQVRALPGVERAAYASNLPFTTRGNSTGFAIEGRPFLPGEPDDVLYRVGTADYLETLGLRLLEGRFYLATDTADTLPVVVINETLRRRFFPEASPLGRRLEIGDVWRTIIGVVADAKESGLEGTPRSGSYLPVVQNATAWAIPEYLVVRTAGDPMAVAAAIREIVWSVDPEQPISQLREMQGWVDRDLADRRGQRRSWARSPPLALGLAALGIYGVLGLHRVATPARDRRAHGARSDATRRGGSSSVDRAPAHRHWPRYRNRGGLGRHAPHERQSLPGPPLRPAHLLGVLAILAAVGVVAALLPTRHATAIEPANALRRRLVVALESPRSTGRRRDD